MTRPKGSLLAASVVVLALATSACAGLRTEDPGQGSDQIPHPTGSDAVVLRVDVGGGFVPIEWTLRRIPSFSVFGDGSLVTEGPQIEIYPGPALPSVQVARLSEEGIQAILEAARTAGLFGPDAHYDYPCVADAGTTTFTVVADGSTHVISAYALEMGGGVGTDPGSPTDEEPPGVGGGEPGSTGSAPVSDPGSEGAATGMVGSDLPAGGPCDDMISAEDRAARAALFDFHSSLFDLRTWLPAGTVGDEQPFDLVGLRIFVQDGVVTPDPGLEQEPQDWPLATPLVSFGQPVPHSELRCGTVTGDDLATLLPTVQQSNELTPWMSAGDVSTLFFRPLLPDEAGC